MTNNNVIVIGSCMIDLICYAKKLPKPGETIHGTNFIIGHGGKGANQCVAAAKLGANTSLIARLGDDSFGLEYKKALENHGINTDHVMLTPNICSGMAQITVSEEGENQIVIVSGANSKLCFDDILQAKKEILSAKVFLFQFETPLAMALEVLQFIKENNSNAVTVVNAAPATDDVDPKLFSLSDIFCVNETEAEELCKTPVNNIEDAKKALLKLVDMGCKTVIVTLGKNGALFNSIEEPFDITHVTTELVVPVDTTGAGDAFIGALAYFLSHHATLPLKHQVQRACAVASASVTKRGTQSSYPNRIDLPQDLFT